MAALSRSRITHGELRVIDGGRAQRHLMTDQEVIEAVERGDGAAADELYDRLIDAVESTLYRMLGKRVADHDDLVQSAFEQIVGTLRRRQFAQACSLRGWAGVITSRIALNAIRARRRRREFLDLTQTADDASRGLTSSSDVHGEVALRRDLTRLRRHLAELPRAKALAVILHDVLGHDLGEIAGLTGASVAATQSRLVRGRGELRRRMKADERRESTEGEKT